MKWILSTLPLLALIALAAVAQPGSAELALMLDPGPNGPNPSVEAIAADEEIVYVARADGWVTAIHRNNTGIDWEWHGDAVHPGPLTILDMVEDSTTLYVVLSDGARAGEAPVVALNKADGEVLWDSATAWADAGYEWINLDLPAAADWDHELDPFRIAIDQKDPDAAEHLYIGTDHGYIIKIDKATGAPALSPVDGKPMAMRPSDPDQDSVVNLTKHLSAIFAVEVYDDNIFASRRFGGIQVGSQNTWGPYLFTHKEQVLYWLDGETMSGMEQVQLVNFQTVPNNDTAPIFPGINDFWIDQTPDQTLHVYMAGAADADSGLFYYLQASGDPNSVTADILHVTAVTTWEADVPNGVTDLALEAGTLGWALTGDDEAIYGLTFEGNAMDLDTSNNGPTGYAVKLDRDTLQPIPGAEGWVRGEQNGRTLFAGRSLSLDLAPGGEHIFIAHANSASPFPAIDDNDPNTPPFDHVAGALIMETPTDSSPAAVLMRPWGYENYAQTAAFAFRTDRPGDDARGMTVDYFIRPAACMEATCWEEMDQIVQLNPGNVYTQDNNVQFDVDDGEYRVKVRITDPLGRSYEDESDWDFTIDQTPPTLGEVFPPDGSLIVTCQPTFTVAGFDETSGINPSASFHFIDVRETAYPYLQFGTSDGRIDGYTLDMSGLNAGQSNPPGCLSQGPHLVHAELVDHAGNFAFKEWTVYVDSIVDKPQLSPPDRTWVNTGSPTFKSQFRESLQVQEATFGPKGGPFEDVTQDVLLVPQHASLNPQGSRVEYRATGLTSGLQYELRLTMSDQHGNIGGPFLSTLRVDTGVPEISNPSPAPGLVVSEGRPRIEADIADRGGSQVLTEDIKMFLDGFAVKARVQTTGISFDPLVPLASGQHTVRLEVTDVAGNQQVLEWAFRVDLDTPGLDMTVSVPTGQTAVKTGDTIRITLAAEDETQIKSITVDARGLGDGYSANEAMPPLQGSPGTFERVFTIETGASKSVLITARVEDAGGLATVRQAPLLIDNTPPIAFMSDLPQRVGAVFTVSWSNNPADDANGGSGVAYYILQQAVGLPAEEEDWKTIRPRVAGTSAQITYPDANTNVLAFRVKAVDRAGNMQPGWSGVVKTEAVGDPFSEMLFPRDAFTGDLASFTVTPRDAFARDANATVAAILQRDDQTLVVPLERIGALYTGKWNLTGLQPGTYEVQFLFTGSDGNQVRSKTQSMEVETVPTLSIDDSPAKKDSPAAHWLVFLLGIAAFSLRSRRQR